MAKPPPPWLERAAHVLDELGRYAFVATHLYRVIAEYHNKMRIPADHGPAEVIEAFLSSGLLRHEEIQPLSRPKANDGSEYRVYKIYVRKGASAIHVALALRPNSFISHASAAQHHGL